MIQRAGAVEGNNDLGFDIDGVKLNLISILSGDGQHGERSNVALHARYACGLPGFVVKRLAGAVWSSASRYGSGRGRVRSYWLFRARPELAPMCRARERWEQSLDRFDERFCFVAALVVEQIRHESEWIGA